MAVQGRRRSRADWSALVAEWAASGTSRSAFAAARGVNPNTLGWWRWHLRVSACPSVAPAAPDDVSFVQVVVSDLSTPTPAPPHFRVEVGVAVVQVPPGFDAGELRRLVAALC